MIIELTEHAITRARERFNINPSSLLRTAQKAFDDGIHHDHAPTQVRKWAQKKVNASQPGSHMRITGHRAYMFCNQRLITVLFVPKAFLPRAKKHHPADL